ncbi:MAG: recombinase family protein, partial [Actinomycetia bacterium]|nr:recombinase family protein [Actinomycetes bacterium]
MSDMGKPVNAIGYVRLSDLRQEDLDANGEGKGLGDQEQRIGAYAARIGWKVTRVIVENDLSPSKGKSRSASAFKRRKIRLPDGRVEYRTVRPGFRTS